VVEKRLDYAEERDLGDEMDQSNSRGIRRWI
jgi:hypothetical protein